VADAAVARQQAGGDANCALPLRHRIIHLVVVDVLVLAELAAAMFFANRYEEQFTLVFVAVFVGLLIPTLSASRLVTRRRLAQCQDAASS
jgi:hypothetical protein